MKTRIKILTLTVLLSSLSSMVMAQDSWSTMNPVEYEATSLNIAPDARAAGLGDVGAATDPDVNSQYWNPAKYPFCISRGGISFNYTPWLRQLVNDIDLANITGYYRLGDYNAISASLRYFSLGEVYTSLNGDMADVIKPYEMAFDVAYSRMLSETFSAAVGLRFIYSDLSVHDDATTPGSAFAADIALYHNGYVNISERECQLSWGLNVSNIGSKISHDGGNTNFFIPTNMRLGTALLVPIDDYNSITFAADANKLLIPTKPTAKQYLESQEGLSGQELEDALTTKWDQYSSLYDTWINGDGYYGVSPITGIFKSFGDAPGGLKEELQEIQWSAGVEYSYNNQFFVRGGYHHENANKGNRKYFTVGAGFKMNVFAIDCGYVISVAQSNPLDQTIRFSLSFDMDGIQDLLGMRRR